MSSLNINNLYETMYERNLKRYEKFDGILQKIHNRIKYNAGKEKTYCFFQIPEFIFGVPLYNINDMKEQHGLKERIIIPHVEIPFGLHQPTVFATTKMPELFKDYPGPYYSGN